MLLNSGLFHAILLQLLQVYCLGVFVPPVVDFAPFHEAIRTALTNRSVPVLTPQTTKNDCGIPARGIMFTYTSDFMFEFILLQRKAMEVSNLRACLESRFVTVCFDEKCLNKCTEHSIPNCVRLLMPEIPPSDFGKEGYLYFTYIKHELMQEALMEADEIFFFDADLLLFRNPFPAAQYGRQDSDGSRIEGPYDIMWQRDRGRGPGCGGSVNSGQMYLRNSTQTLKYTQGMKNLRDQILTGCCGLDQDFVANVTFTYNLRYCALPATEFTAHCLMVFGNIHFINYNAPARDMVSYHTSCVEGHGNKKYHLERVLKDVSSSSRHGLTLQRVLRK